MTHFYNLKVILDNTIYIKRYSHSTVFDLLFYAQITHRYSTDFILIHHLRNNLAAMTNLIAFLLFFPINKFARMS